MVSAKKTRALIYKDDEAVFALLHGSVKAGHSFKFALLEVINKKCYIFGGVKSFSTVLKALVRNLPKSYFILFELHFPCVLNLQCLFSSN
jgi:hypothetical protein